MAKPAEPELILRVKPVPKPLHGVNLRSFLGQHKWRKLRQSLLDESTRQCETCGKLVENSSRLHGHEEWIFDTAAQPPTAKVTRIRFVCWHCHACEHFPHTVLMVTEGILSEQAIEDTIEHFCRVNQVNQRQFQRHLDMAMKQWEHLSQFQFEVDFGEYAKNRGVASELARPPQQPAIG